MKLQISNKAGLWILCLFCVSFTLIILKALMQSATISELSKVFVEGIYLPNFWGAVIAPAIAAIAIAYIAASKRQRTSTIVLSYLPAILAGIAVTTLGMPIVGAFLLLSLSWHLYSEYKSCSSSS